MFNKVFAVSVFSSLFMFQLASATPQADPNALKIQTIQCAQDIVDNRLGYELTGLTKSIDILEKILASEDSPQDLNSMLTDCQAFTNIEEQRDIDVEARTTRETQLSALESRKKDPIYYFLRGIIRPLIACYAQRNTLDAVCISTTGKSWRELRGRRSHELRQQNSPNLIHYRLGHSDGLRVQGPQDQVSEEDRNLIGLLMPENAEAIILYVEEATTREFSRLRIIPRESTDQFIRYYFINN